MTKTTKSPPIIKQQQNKSVASLNTEEFHYKANWYADDSTILLTELQQLPWQQEHIYCFGRRVIVPRLVLWMGDPTVHYRYAGVDHIPLAWHPSVYQLKVAIEQYCRRYFKERNLGGLPPSQADLQIKCGKASQEKSFFNAVLANYYADGSHYMGWHSDNETELGDNPLIASFSIGAKRRFYLRHKQTRVQYELSLTDGSLLLMYGQCQHRWRHCLPKMRRVTEPRINLTFRLIH